MGSGNILPIRESHPWNFFFRRPSALISEPSALISTLTYMPIKVDILDSGTHLERSAAKNYANPRYKCAEISDMDPIGDQNHNQGNPQFRSHPNPLIKTAIPAPWCGRIWVGNGVGVRATGVKTRWFCTEFRAGCNGTSPGPQTGIIIHTFGINANLKESYPT